MALATLTGHPVLVAVSWEALLVVYIMVKALGATGLVK
jgi:hypothetical protein